MPAPVRSGDFWLWVGGPVPPGSDGITLGSLVIVTSRASADDRFAGLVRHEAVHVRQWRTLGFGGFVRRYLGSYLRWRARGYGHWAAYRRIPLEIEARCASGYG